ncbi:MAG TPA: hypothetical protein PKD32_11260 [Saprospiraceae bacterium]|nr:hypothetical protein [Saprospiraceae bacterium]
MLARNLIASQKNQECGEVIGSGKTLQGDNDICNRQHILKVPNSDETKQYFIVPNPLPDLYFPPTVDQVKEAHNQPSYNHIKQLTHIWFQIIK